MGLWLTKEKKTIHLLLVHLREIHLFLNGMELEEKRVNGKYGNK